MISKGPIAGGTVTVTDANGVVVATATTDPYGAYSVSVPAATPAPVTLSITKGIDTVTGAAPDFPLKTIVPYVANGTPLTQVNANANVFSTVVAAAATAKAGGVAVTQADLDAQEATLVDSLGMGLDIGSKPSSDISAGSAGAIMAANEALAEVIRRTTVTKAQNAGGAAATSADMVDTLASLAADISDGALDGYAAPAAITAAVANTNASATKVTSASVATSTSVTASKASTVVTEAFKNGGSVNVTDIYGAVAKPAATVKTSLETAASNAAQNVAIAYANASIASVGTAPKIAPVVLSAPAASTVTKQTATATSVASTVEKALATKAQTDIAAAAAVGATAAQIATAQQAAADAYAAATAFAEAATGNAAATNAVVVKAGANVTAAQTKAANDATTAANNATAQVATAASTDTYAQAGAAGMTAASTSATAQVAAANTAATQAAKDAANAKAIAAARGVAVVQNTITIGGKAVTLSGIGAANLPAATPVTAAGLTIAIPLMDYYGSLSPAVSAPIQMIIDDQAGRRINATLSTTLSSVNGVVSVTPVGSINYSGRTLAGTTKTGVLVANTAITSAQGTLTVNISALAAAAGIAIKPGNYGFSLGIGNVNLQFLNFATGVGFVGPFPVTAAGKGISGQFTVI